MYENKPLVSSKSSQIQWGNLSSYCVGNGIQIKFSLCSILYNLIDETLYNPSTTVATSKLLEMIGRSVDILTCRIATALHLDINQTAGSGKSSEYVRKSMRACYSVCCQPRRAGDAAKSGQFIGQFSWDRFVQTVVRGLLNMPYIQLISRFLLYLVSWTSPKVDLRAAWWTWYDGPWSSFWSPPDSVSIDVRRVLIEPTFRTKKMKLTDYRTSWKKFILRITRLLTTMAPPVSTSETTWILILRKKTVRNLFELCYLARIIMYDQLMGLI